MERNGTRYTDRGDSRCCATGFRRQQCQEYCLERYRIRFQRVQHLLNELQGRVDRMSNKCYAGMQLVAARQGIAESHHIGRLTWLATVSVPFSFVTGLFSMNEDLKSLRITFKWFFATAVPWAIVGLMVAGWSSKILRRVKLMIKDSSSVWSPKVTPR
ncbi:hypothetical protein CC86DRAFT_433081 [Ophiobolus disseminans]|uniref:Uncharacterized protein n=1 Tax=Ophiobolus disseminans TaxID=1469910 RepID=A0A6A6ZEK5_9PLEO|nr:hypothetical protein CC86DRAFT_433081 [Ophiobolus disseminans]